MLETTEEGWGLSRVLVIFQTFSLVQSEDAYPL